MKFDAIEAVTRPIKPNPHGTSSSPKAVGERSEAIIAARLVEVGYYILMPYGDNLRYDLVIEDADKRFWRVQCKTGRVSQSRTHIHFSAASSYAHTRAGKAGIAHKNYQGQIDYFAVYCIETKGVYLVPIDHITGDVGKLRIKPVTSYRAEIIRWARDYRI